jgi:hypothetical protein
MEVNKNNYFSSGDNQTVQCQANTIYNVSMTINNGTNTVIATNGTNVVITAHQSTNYTPINILTLDNNYIGTYVRCHYYELLKNGTIVAKLYPAERNSDKVLGMYDVINNTFYTNAGTGSFIAGDKLP